MFEITYIATAFLYAVTGVIVFVANPKNRGHLYFFCSVTTFAIWALLTGLAYTVFNMPEDGGLLVSRLIYAFGIFPFYFAWLFFTVFPKRIYKKASYFHIFIGVFALCVSALSACTDLVVESLSINNELNYATETPGVLYPVYAFVYLLLFIFSLVASVQQLVTNSFLNKVRISLVAFGFYILAIATGLFLIILPSFEIYLFQKEVIFSGIPFVLLTAYAMKRYQLLSIKVLVLRITQVFCSIGGGILIGLYVQHGIVQFSEAVRSDSLQGAIFSFAINSHFCIAIVILCSAAATLVIYHIFYRFLLAHLEYRLLGILRDIFNKTIFAKGNDELNATLEMSFRQKLSIKNAHILFEKNSSNSYLWEYFSDPSRRWIVNDITFLEFNKQYFTSDFRKHLDAHCVALCFPVYQGVTLIGLFVVDHKHFNDPYTGYELEELSSFAQNLSISIKNIAMREQMFDWNKSLQQEVKERTSDLRAEKEKLEELYAKQSEFITIATHELRTPLTIASLQAEYLGMEDLKGEVKAGVARVSDALKKLAALMKSIFTVQQYDLDKIVTQFEKTDIKIFINDIYKGFKDVCQHKNITLELANNIPSETLINADPQQLRQVFHNILSNCVRHAPHQGRIVITADYQHKTGDILVSIADNGPGVPDAKKHIIFEKFATDGTGKQSGVGLGLYICRRILEAHHGEIWVEDHHPGAKFSFRFQ